MICLAPASWGCKLSCFYSHVSSKEKRYEVQIKRKKYVCELYNCNLILYFYIISNLVEKTITKAMFTWICVRNIGHIDSWCVREVSSRAERVVSWRLIRIVGIFEVRSSWRCVLRQKYSFKQQNINVREEEITKSISRIFFHYFFFILFTDNNIPSCWPNSL